jgi:hypothetical protein
VAQIKAVTGFEFEESTPYNNVKTYSQRYFVSGDNLIAIKKKGLDVFVQRYNTTIPGLESIETYQFPKMATFHDVIAIDNNLYLFFTTPIIPDGPQYLFYQKISFESGKYVGEPVLMLTTNIRPAGRFTYLFNSDSTKFLVKYRKYPENKNDAINYDVIGLAVFDRNLQYLWGKEIIMPYTEKRINNLDYAVDKQGNVFIMTVVFTNDIHKMRLGKDGPNFRLELMKVEASNKDLLKFPVFVKDNIMSDIKLSDGPENEIICSGFYTYGDDPFNMEGIFLYKFNEEGSVVKENLFEFTNEFINEYANKGTVRKNDKKDPGESEMSNIQLRKMGVEKDGSVTIIAEKKYYVSRTKDLEEHHYDEIMAGKINPDGTLAWIKKLPKRQMGGIATNTLSFKYLSTPEFHYFFFLDDIKNLSLLPDKTPAVYINSKEGYLTAYRINKLTGVTVKLSLMDIKDIKGIKMTEFTPDNFILSSDKNLLFETPLRGKEDVLVKVKMDEQVR